MYGLRTAPKSWQDHLSEVMAQLNYVRSKTEPNLYYRHQAPGVSEIFILIYVDDIMMFGSSAVTQAAYQEMQNHFLIKDLGEVGQSEVVQRFF